MGQKSFHVASFILFFFICKYILFQIVYYFRHKKNCRPIFTSPDEMQIQTDIFCQSRQKLGKNSFSKKVYFVVHLKIDQNEKLVSLKKTCSLAFLTKIWDTKNFTFASENGQTSEARGKKQNKLSRTVPTTAMLIVFSK